MSLRNEIQAFLRDKYHVWIHLVFSGETANPSIWSLGTLGKGTSAQPLADHEDNHDDEKFAIPPPPRVTRKIGSSSPHVVQMGAPSSGGGLHLVLIMIS